MKSLFLFAPILALLAFSGCVSEQAGATGLASAGQGSDNGYLSIQLEEIGQQAKFLEYNANGTTVKFFAVKAGDGSIKTAFDACDVCYSKKKGYRQEGSFFMVCNNCGKRFAIGSLGTENRNPGGCWPSYLPNKVEGSVILIKKADLENGRRLFV